MAGLVYSCHRFRPSETISYCGDGTCQMARQSGSWTPLGISLGTSRLGYVNVETRSQDKLRTAHENQSVVGESHSGAHPKSSYAERTAQFALVKPLHGISGEGTDGAFRKNMFEDIALRNLDPLECNVAAPVDFPRFSLFESVRGSCFIPAVARRVTGKTLVKRARCERSTKNYSPPGRPTLQQAALPLGLIHGLFHVPTPPSCPDCCDARLYCLATI